MRAVAQIKHERVPFQRNKINPFMALTRVWRTLGSTIQTAWNQWSVYCPQPTKFDPTHFLTGYQCFLRRCYYERLFLNSSTFIMPAPEIVTYQNDVPTFETAIVSNRLMVRLTFSRSAGDIVCNIFASAPVPDSANYCGNNYRYMLSCSSANQTVDITIPYLANFLTLPGVAQKIFVDYVNAGVDNGQLWFHENLKEIILPSLPPIEYFVYTFSCASRFTDPEIEGWHLPTIDELRYLIAQIGGWENSSNKMRCVGTSFWDAPNDGALDSYGLHFKGIGGINYETGEWENVGLTAQVVSNSGSEPEEYLTIYMDQMSADAVESAYRTKDGFPVRLCNPNTALTNGETGSWTSASGLVYPSVCIGEIEWLTVDLKESVSYLGVALPFKNEGAEWQAMVGNATAYCKKELFV
jgi:uncharacterized protein (TIGR02145 family)